MFKRNFGFLVAVLVLLCCCLFVSAQVKQYPKSLLWKISGKGLQHPSYLYGTIHLTDKRVFNFGDSLYRALESVEGLATELHLDSATNEFLYKEMSVDTTPLLTTLLSKKDFNRLAPKIASRAGKPAAEATVKDLLEAQADYAKEMHNDDMNTFMDAWLFGTAKKQGKWVGGIEDISDQEKYIYPDIKNAEDVEQLLRKKSVSRKSVEFFVETYLNQDLEEISAITDLNYNDNAGLIKRNIKMSVRMDSLANIRSTFFAVGAAHLPGKQGVIELLEAQGYQLTPVWSKSRIAANTYKYKEVKAEWISVIDDDSSYSVLMPGIPDESIQKITPLNMKVFADISSGMAFVCGARPTPLNTENADSVMAQMMKLIEEKGGKYEPSRSIEVSGMKGREVTGKKDNNYVRVQFFLHGKYVYVFILSATTKELLNGDDAKRFFSSIKPLKGKMPEAWVSFTPPGEYVSIKMPGQATPLKLPANEELGKSMALSVYTSVDRKSGNTYLLRCSKTLGDYYLPNDSIYFRQLRDAFMQNPLKPVVVDSAMTIFNGYPAYSLTMRTENDFAIRFLFINRGNRNYVVAAVSSWEKRQNNDVESFFSSLNFIDYPEKSLQRISGLDNAFTAEASNTFVLKTRSDDTTIAAESFTPYVYSYDSIAAIGYCVMPDSVNLFTWHSKDSVYYELLRKAYTNYKDSAGSVRVVKNGLIPGIEMDVYSKAAKQIKRVRILFDEYVHYEIFAFMPLQLAEKPYYNRFFETFRLTKETPPVSLYQNKGCLLLKALNSSDSTQRKKAEAALSGVPFDSSNMSCLYEAMLKDYPADSSAYETNNRKIFDIVSTLSDSNVVKHIETIYPSLSKEQQKFSNELLDILANEKTTYSYQVLNKLLKTRLPEEKSNNLFYSLSDSLQLTASLFPEVLQYAADSNMVMGLASISNSLLDSSLISIESVKQYKRFWESAATRRLKDYQQPDNETYFPFINDLLDLLGKLNSVEGNRLLQQYAGVKNRAISFSAVKVLLSNKQPIQAKHLTSLCSHNDYRQYVYDTLKGANRIKLFPVKYLTQKYFAEAALHEISSDEYESDLKFLGERQFKFNGKLQKFYLFKVTLRYDEDGEETEEHLGIAGSYDLNPAKVEMTTDASSLYYDEEFDMKKLEKQVSALLKRMREEYEGNK